MLFGTKQLIRRLRDIIIPFFGKDQSPSPFCKGLGIIIDSNLSFNEHIDYLLFLLSGKLCQINRVRHLFAKDVLLVVLNSFAFCKLFYCSSVWSGTTQQLIRKLHLLRNFAVKILTRKRRYDHISSILKDLRWLTVKEMLQLRNVIMVYKCQHGLVSDYVVSKLVKHSNIHNYNTRQIDNINIEFRRTSIAKRSFFDHAINSFKHSARREL